MMADMNRLQEIIRQKSYNADGDFKLASGVSSRFFFDMKVTLLDPEGINLVADAFIDRLAGDHIHAIGGLVIGACPIVSAVCLKSHTRSFPIQGFYVRKEPKKRGTQKMIEGAVLQKGDRIVIVDDVTTSGGSALQAVDEVEGLGCTVVKVMTIIDRHQGAAENLAKRGLTLEALFTKDDFD